ncbi:MAG: cytochrome C peroxidase [Phaeodactylibacter sp.]|nr:cytochrome C peroxidase [Phaeodactylibacter sp.]
MNRKVTTIFTLIALLLAAACQKETATPPGNENDWVYNPTPYNLEVPAFFPLLDIPSGNPMTVQGVQLGRMLFYDPALHHEGARACASCHVQEFSFSSDPEVLPHINLAWNSAFLWDGKVQGSLEDIMLFEVKDFFKADLGRLEAHPDYPRLFYEAFGEGGITYERAAMALAQFERTMASGNSKYDQVLRQEPGVFLTDQELNGYDLFFTEEGDCFHCHGGILFTDNEFHNNALDAEPEVGLGAITGSPFDRGRFKTPTLRNIELTGPYMHDGRYATLEEVIDFYSEGLHASPTADPLMKALPMGGKHFTGEEKSALIAFLKTLTDTSYTTNPSLSSPF